MEVEVAAQMWGRFVGNPPGARATCLCHSTQF
jgi:hypothetical protein